MIPLSEPHIAGNEWRYVKECLDSGWVSSVGKYVDLFEERLAEYTGAKYAVATANGTAALHLSLLCAGLKPGDEVLVPTITFIAPINAVHYCGAHPVFFDCTDSFNIDPDGIRFFLTSQCETRDGVTINRTTGRRVWGILPVHVFGTCAQIDDLVEIADQFNLIIIEDATESLGSKHLGKHSGLFGRAGTFSFNGNKIITTGGGGMIITDDEALARHARYLSTQAKDDGRAFIHNEVGYNYRLTNIQAAVGVAQLEQLGNFIARKKRIFSIYQDQLSILSGIALQTPTQPNDANYWLFALRLPEYFSVTQRDRFAEIMRAHNVETRPVWYPNHLQQPYKKCEAFSISRALRLVSSTLCIPCSVGLSEEQQATVIASIRAAHAELIANTSPVYEAPHAG